MDPHYLTPLFAPRSIVVFAGTAQADEADWPQAATLLQALKAQRFQGTLQFVDTQTRGTLADLVQTKADLAIIALPNDEIPAALELAGRIACRSALKMTCLRCRNPMCSSRPPMAAAAPRVPCRSRSSGF